MKKMIATLAFSAFFLTPAFAGDVDPRDSQAVLAEIERMNLQEMPQDVAEGLRGEFVPPLSALVGLINPDAIKGVLALAAVSGTHDPNGACCVLNPNVPLAPPGAYQPY